MHKIWVRHMLSCACCWFNILLLSSPSTEVNSVTDFSWTALGSRTVNRRLQGSFSIVPPSHLLPAFPNHSLAHFWASQVTQRQCAFVFFLSVFPESFYLFPFRLTTFRPLHCPLPSHVSSSLPNSPEAFPCLSLKFPSVSPFEVSSFSLPKMPALIPPKLGLHASFNVKHEEREENGLYHMSYS